MKSIKFIISGGGTGGHIYPALAIAAGIKDNFKNPKILFVGARGKMEMDKIPREGFPIIGLWISGFQRSFSFYNLLFPLKLILSLIVLFTLILFSAFWYFSAGLPDYKKLSNYEPPISSRVYSNNGSLVAEYAIEKRLFIPR